MRTISILGWICLYAKSIWDEERDSGEPHPYAFGTENASFHTCAGCGIVPFVTSLIDGEDENARLARWKRNWIADVEYVDSTEAITPGRAGRCGSR
jgi:hypothetical protein